MPTNKIENQNKYRATSVNKRVGTCEMKTQGSGVVPTSLTAPTPTLILYQAFLFSLHARCLKYLKFFVALLATKARTGPWILVSRACHYRIIEWPEVPAPCLYWSCRRFAWPGRPRWCRAPLASVGSEIKEKEVWPDPPNQNVKFRI